MNAAASRLEIAELRSIYYASINIGLLFIDG